MAIYGPPRNVCIANYQVAQEPQRAQRPKPLRRQGNKGRHQGHLLLVPTLQTVRYGDLFDHTPSLDEGVPISMQIWGQGPQFYIVLGTWGLQNWGSPNSHDTCPECFWSITRHVQGSVNHHCTCSRFGDPYLYNIGVPVTILNWGPHPKINTVMGFSIVLNYATQNYKHLCYEYRQQ